MPWGFTNIFSLSWKKISLSTLGFRTTLALLATVRYKYTAATVGSIEQRRKKLNYPVVWFVGSQIDLSSAAGTLWILISSYLIRANAKADLACQLVMNPSHVWAPNQKTICKKERRTFTWLSTPLDFNFVTAAISRLFWRPPPNTERWCSLLRKML